MSMKNIAEFNQKARALKLLILDVDGVLTDGRLFFNDQGTEYKCFHARDGHGIKLLQQIGIDVAVISGRKSNAVALRMESLGVKYVFQGQENKIPAFESLLTSMGVSASQVAHMGDDLPDLPIMTRVGLSITVNDGHAAVKEYADWCSELNGGQGAVREISDLILTACGKMDAVLSHYCDE